MKTTTKRWRNDLQVVSVEFWQVHVVTFISFTFFIASILGQERKRSGFRNSLALVLVSYPHSPGS